MSKVKELIEKAIERKPLDIKEIVEDIMQEKVRSVIAEEIEEFNHLEEDELTEEQEMALFFAEFKEKYGDLPMEEQEQIMDELMAEAEAEEDSEEVEFEFDPSQFGFENEEDFFEHFDSMYGDLAEDEQHEVFLEIMESEDAASAFISGQKRQIEKKSKGKGAAEKMPVASKKQPSNKLPDVQ